MSTHLGCWKNLSTRLLSRKSLVGCANTVTCIKGKCGGGFTIGRFTCLGFLTRRINFPLPEELGAFATLLQNRRRERGFQLTCFPAASSVPDSASVHLLASGLSAMQSYVKDAAWTAAGLHGARPLLSFLSPTFHSSLLPFANQIVYPAASKPSLFCPSAWMFNCLQNWTRDWLSIGPSVFCVSHYKILKDTNKWSPIDGSSMCSKNNIF